MHCLTSRSTPVSIFCVVCVLYVFVAFYCWYTNIRKQENDYVTQLQRENSVGTAIYSICCTAKTVNSCTCNRPDQTYSTVLKYSCKRAGTKKKFEIFWTDKWQSNRRSRPINIKLTSSEWRHVRQDFRLFSVHFYALPFTLLQSLATALYKTACCMEYKMLAKLQTEFGSLALACDALVLVFCINGPNTSWTHKVATIANSPSMRVIRTP